MAMYPGTREAEVDDILRRRKLVDLFKVIREGMRRFRAIASAPANAIVVSGIVGGLA
jgi:hypothetical protein